jgi:type IX secretion system substrate protein
MKKILLSSLAILFISFCIKSQTITLHPVQEGMVDSANASNNYPNYPDFLANAWTNGGNPLTERSLMQFDFSSIPMNATIISAQLSLYGHNSIDNTQNSSPLSGSNASLLQRVTAAWSPNTVTWNNQPATTTTNQVPLAESISSTENYLNIDIKNMVVDMINNGNYGFMFRLDTESYYRCLLFATMANSDTATFPTLVINYSVGNTTCTTIYPSQEGMVDSANASNNYPNYPDFLANAWTNGGNPLTERSLMQFDLSFIPNNATLDSALLSLYGHSSIDNTQNSSPLSGSNASILERVTAAWNPNTVTWNNQPATTTTNSVGLAQSTSSTENYLNIDLKPMVTDMITYGNNGFLMRLDNEVYYTCLLFATTANTDSTVFPRMKVCYTNNTGINPISSNTNNIIIYPNPSNGIYSIIYSNKTNQKSTLEVINVLGQIVYSKMLAGNGSNISETINLSDQANGIYLITINNGTEVITKKVVKE